MWFNSILTTNFQYSIFFYKGLIMKDQDLKILDLYKTSYTAVNPSDSIAIINKETKEIIYASKKFIQDEKIIIGSNATEILAKAKNCVVEELLSPISGQVIGFHLTSKN